MELTADTSRADGPLLAIYCQDGSQFAAGKELYRQNLSDLETCFSKNNAENLILHLRILPEPTVHTETHDSEERL